MKRICFSIVFLLLALMMLSSCKTKYIPVETVRTEYITKTDSFLQKDSIYCHDSIYIEKSGDTILSYRYKTIYRDRWRDVYKTDTIIRENIIENIVPVEKDLSWWQKFKIYCGECLLIILLIVLLYILLRHFYRGS